jgi:hypothetical protein
MADTSVQFRELQAEFQRIADRIPSIRARVHVKGGRFILFVLGHPIKDDEDQGIVGTEANPIHLELYRLTEQAGNLAAELLRSKRYQGKVAAIKSVHYDLSSLQHLWLMLLLHTPPLCFYCWAIGADGKKHPALTQLGESEIGIWIEWHFPKA